MEEICYLIFLLLVSTLLVLDKISPKTASNTFSVKIISVCFVQ